MPSSLFTDGGYIEFCPAGVSDAVMAIVHPNHSVAKRSITNDLAAKHIDGKHDTGNKINKAHTAHHSDGHFHNHHGVAASDVNHSDLFSDANNEQLESAWQANCDYGFIKSSTDDSLLALQLTTVVSKATFEQQQRRYQDVIATFRRKQQPRAPPIFS